jgi:hypothetical protein
MAVKSIYVHNRNRCLEAIRESEDWIRVIRIRSVLSGSLAFAFLRLRHMSVVRFLSQRMIVSPQIENKASKGYLQPCQQCRGGEEVRLNVLETSHPPCSCFWILSHPESRNFNFPKTFARSSTPHAPAEDLLNGQEEAASTSPIRTLRLCCFPIGVPASWREQGIIEG